jgi:hypothetical protein
MMANSLTRTDEGLLNLKDLLTILAHRSGDSFGLCRATESQWRQPVGFAVVDGRFADESWRRFAQSKGLNEDSSAELSGKLFGFRRAIETGRVYLLIPQGLIAKLLRRVRERVLHLKELLTVFPPSLEPLLKTSRVLRPLFHAESYRIPPFSAKNLQIMAEMGVFLDRFRN